MKVSRALVLACAVAVLLVSVEAAVNPHSAASKLSSLSHRVFAETQAEATDACGAIGGTCKDISTCSATVVRGKCPGSAANICCVPSSSAAPAAAASSSSVTSYGSCTANGQSGICKKASTCTGTTVSGKCPGDSSIKCCIGGASRAAATTTTPASAPAAASSSSARRDTRLPVPLGGVCTQNGQSGICSAVSKCNGGIVRGLCAGNGSISCCMTKEAAAKAGLPKVRPSAVVRKPYVPTRSAADRAAELEMRNKFSRFKARNRRRYKSVAAEVAAYATFKINRQRIIAMNDRHRKADQTQPLFKSTSQFTDMPLETFKRFFLTARPTVSDYSFLETETGEYEPHNEFDPSAPAGEHATEEEIEAFQSEFDESELLEVEEQQGPVAPTNAVNDGTVQVTGEMIVDWRSKSSPIKNQQQCGSCWAHASVSVLETAVAKAQDVSAPILSVQQVVDCNTVGQGGCHGGSSMDAFSWLKEHGAATETAYPYTATNATCLIENGTGPKVKSWSMSDKDETVILTNLKKYGAMVVYVSAHNWSTYNSGIFPKTACDNTSDKIDHAVVLVGYGVENGVNFWLVRNHWATTWGEQGFIRMEAGVNSCGLALYPSYIEV